MRSAGEVTRTGEISTASQTVCGSGQQRSDTRPHQTRPTGRLTPSTGPDLRRSITNGSGGWPTRAVLSGGAGPAAQQAACGQPASAGRSVPVYRLGRVLRATRRLRAGRRQGAEFCLVEADAAAQQPRRPAAGPGTRRVPDGRDVRLGPPGPRRRTHRSYGSGGKQQRADEGNHAAARHAAGRPHGPGRRHHQRSGRLPCPDSHCCPPRGLPEQSALIALTRDGEQYSWKRAVSVRTWPRRRTAGCKYSNLTVQQGPYTTEAGS